MTEEGYNDRAKRGRQAPERAISEEGRGAMTAVGDDNGAWV